MIYIIITACIHNKRGGIINFDARKKRYIMCINKLLEFLKEYPNIKPIIVENNGDKDTYLNDINCEVLYTNNNSIDTENKGMNELMDIQDTIKHLSANDDDIIIKLTGRYRMIDPKFIEIVTQNIDNYDAFIRFYNVCTKQTVKNDMVLGLYALRCKYLKKITLEGHKKNNTYKSPEMEFSCKVRTLVKEERIKEIDDLRIECCFADKNRLQKV